MRIIYGYSNCTDKKYKELMSERGAAAMVPDQKYHGLLIKGLAANGAEVRCYSGLPVNRAVTSRKLIREPDEQEGSAHYHYITTLNLPVIRQAMIFFGAFFGILTEKKDKETYAICDFLNSAAAMGLILACKLRRIRKAAIVTDIPDMFSGSGLNRFVRNFILRRFDGYIFLTEQMNDFNRRKRPYIVMEGHADARAADVPPQERYEVSEGRKVVMYAGSIANEYGISDMARGFAEAQIPNAELRLYGGGVDAEELKAYAQDHPTVKFLGSLPNDRIVIEEHRAALLINPRPTAEEFTRYSFPSKNMEYMASGTPVLTTRLPGMPAEYEPYVYFIDDETPDGIAAALKKVLSLPYEERCRKGAGAREFVLKNKSNTVQAAKIIGFLPKMKKRKTRA